MSALPPKADIAQRSVEALTVAQCRIIVRVEKPSEYLKTAAYLMPKEFEITETRLMEIPDDELDAFIEFARRRIAERALGASIREAETLN